MITDNIKIESLDDLSPEWLLFMAYILGFDIDDTNDETILNSLEKAKEKIRRMNCETNEL